jgi:hypothetical protein
MAQNRSVLIIDRMVLNFLLKEVVRFAGFLNNPEVIFTLQRTVHVHNRALPTKPAHNFSPQLCRIG